MKGARVLTSDALSVLRESMRVSLKEVPKYTNTVREKMIVRLNDATDYYKNITGFDELDRCQKLVTNLQSKLLEAQEKRREIGLELANVRRKSNEVQDQLHKVKRQENLQRFLDLMKDETELLRAEQDVNKVFQQQDRAEREIFSAFTNAIRDSHERQRAHVERTKYLGMVLSIVGSLVSYSVSSLRTEDLKKTIAVHMRSNYEPMVAKMHENEHLIQSTMSGIKWENTRLLQVLNSKLNDADISELSSLELGRKSAKVALHEDEADKAGDEGMFVFDESRIKFAQKVLTYSILAVLSICVVKLLGD